MAEKFVYLNGKYMPIAEASVSVLDRGFLFGDGVYEVIPVFGDNLLRVDEHLTRLNRSLERITLDNPLSSDEWKKEFKQLLDCNPGGDRAIYLQITRGAYPVRDLKIPPNVEPTVFMMTLEVQPVDIKVLGKGIETITIEDFRWSACDIKSTSLVANVMLRQQATHYGVVDAVLIKEGKVTEGTASNLLIVKDNVLITPPTGKHLLPGITRDLVLELAIANDVKTEIRNIAAKELRDADEVWLTSSTREIAPVVRLNDKLIGRGKAGPLWHKMINIYQDYKQQLRQA
jgi:D-alanine transaminase